MVSLEIIGTNNVKQNDHVLCIYGGINTKEKEGMSLRGGKKGYVGAAEGKKGEGILYNYILVKKLFLLKANIPPWLRKISVLGLRTQHI